MKSPLLGYNLIHEGALAFLDVEKNGIKVDTKYLIKSISKLESLIEKKTKELKEGKTWKIWSRAYQKKAKISSREQLGDVIFNKIGHPIVSRTETGKISTDDEALSRVDSSFVRKWRLLEKYKDAKVKYLEGILKYTKKGRLYPTYNLNTAATFRSSCTEPNFQNMPIRDPWYSNLIRSAIVADDDDYVLAEIDYGQIEVRVAACYNKDPTLIKYVTGKGDMHADLAMQLYFLKAHQVSKEARHCSKNMFVFPQFYGDYYRKCAYNLWEAIHSMNLCVKDTNRSLTEVLKKHGITELSLPDPDGRPVKGTYEYHVKTIENHFWHNRFSVYTTWKNDWYDAYLEKGYFDTLTGFTIKGNLRKNQVINYPIQGSAFHCLLWSLIHINKWLQKYTMKSKIVGQIHDSILLCVHRKELQTVLQKCKEIMTERLRKQWDWIIVPLVVEADVTPQGGSWAQKKSHPI